MVATCVLSHTTYCCCLAADAGPLPERHHLWVAPNNRLAAVPGARARNRLQLCPHGCAVLAGWLDPRHHICYCCQAAEQRRTAGGHLPCDGAVPDGLCTHQPVLPGIDVAQFSPDQQRPHRRQQCQQPWHAAVGQQAGGCCRCSRAPSLTHVHYVEGR